MWWIPVALLRPVWSAALGLSGFTATRFGWTRALYRSLVECVQGWVPYSVTAFEPKNTAPEGPVAVALPKTAAGIAAPRLPVTVRREAPVRNERYALSTSAPAVYV